MAADVDQNTRGTWGWLWVGLGVGRPCASGRQEYTPRCTLMG